MGCAWHTLGRATAVRGLNAVIFALLLGPHGQQPTSVDHLELQSLSDQLGANGFFSFKWLARKLLTLRASLQRRKSFPDSARPSFCWWIDHSDARLLAQTYSGYSENTSGAQDVALVPAASRCASQSLTSSSIFLRHERNRPSPPKG